MEHPEQRQELRDSLFVLARLTVEGRQGEVQVRVRNLSKFGLMAEGSVKVACGTPVKVDVRNVGWVSGKVAWVQDNRFGIGFDEEIDARHARMATDHADTGNLWRPTVSAKKMWSGPDPARLRKI